MLRARVVDQLGYLHEVDRRRDTVQAGHPLPQLLGEEALGRLLRVPDLEVRRPAVLLIEREELAAQARHPLEHAPRVPGYPDDAGPIKVVVVLEGDVHTDHSQATVRRATHRQL